MALENNDIKRLTDIYREAEEKIIRQLRKLDPNKTYTQNRKALLSNLKKIEKELLAESEEWSEEVVPKNYKTGSNSVIKDLREYKQPNINIAFTTADRTTIRALIDSSNARFANTMQGITRAGINTLSELTERLVRNAIASDIGAGISINTIAKDVLAEISDTGITAFVDKAGRRWSLTRYSNMLARTTVMQARNDGSLNRLLQNGQRYGKISKHADIDGDDICNVYENKIVDLADPAIPLPPYHPNCRHIVQFVPPRKLKAFLKTQ